jgi:uncharacterized protein
MSRLLFLLAVITVVYMLLKSFQRQTSKPDESDEVEDMVRCSQCGVHLPRSESISADENYFCCDEHRREYKSK